MRASENGMLRRASEPKAEEIGEGQIIFHDEKLNNFVLSPNCE
jgi:hypothetical protein